LPQQALVVAGGEPGHGQHASVEQRAEEGGEEHHLREDEPAHRPAEGLLHPAAVLAADRLAHDLAEPAEQHVDQHRDAGEEDPLPGRHVVEPQRCAGTEQQQRERADDRIGRRFGYEIMFDGLAHGPASRVFLFCYPTTSCTTSTSTRTKIPPASTPATTTASGFSEPASSM